MTAHIEFLYASRILRRFLHHFSYTNIFACAWHCSFFHGSWVPSLTVFLSWVFGSLSCFFSLGPWVPSLAVFLSSRPFGTCLIKPSTRLLVHSFSCYLVLGFASHVTRLCFFSWSAGCVLHRRLWTLVSSLSPRACLPRSFASSRLTAIFLVVVVHVVFLQLHLVVVYSDVACGWSLQHCRVVLCYDVVAGPAPVQ